MFILYGATSEESMGGPFDVLGAFETIDEAKAAFYEANLKAKMGLFEPLPDSDFDNYHSHLVHKNAWATIVVAKDHRYEAVLVYCRNCANNNHETQWESPPYPSDFFTYTEEDFEYRTVMNRVRAERLASERRAALKGITQH